MDCVSHVDICDLSSSLYIRPRCVSFIQHGKKARYDCFCEHDDVVVLIYNVSRDVLIFVKQFRPAVYLHNCNTSYDQSKEVIDTDKYPGSLGVTIELCSGIVDKNKSLIEIAQAEVLEECGYDAPLENLTHVTSYRCGSVISGASSTLYFAQVTDAMRVGPGGGLAEEGEMIDIVEMSTTEAQALMLDDAVNRDLALVLALQWFFHQHMKS